MARGSLAGRVAEDGRGGKAKDSFGTVYFPLLGRMFCVES